MPPIFAAIGTAVGASAATATMTGAVVAGTTAMAGASVYSASKQSKDAKSAAAQADARAKAAAAELKGSQDAAASQAAESLRARKAAQIAGSQSVYTSPLGIGGTAEVNRKTLLGQ